MRYIPKNRRADGRKKPRAKKTPEERANTELLEPEERKDTHGEEADHPLAKDEAHEKARRGGDRPAEITD